jgi:hypothetical protein
MSFGIKIGNLQPVFQVLLFLPTLVYPATKIFSRSQVPHGVGKGVDEKTAATGVARSFILHGSHGQLLRMMCSYVFLSQKINGSEHYSKASKFR